MLCTAGCKKTRGRKVFKEELMKRIGIALITAIAISIAACEDGSGPSGKGPAATVTKVTVTVDGGGKAETWCGGEIKLSAQVEGEGAYSKDVTWSIIEEEDGIAEGTAISTDGVLTVGIEEWNEMLTVRARSVLTKTQFGTLKISIVEPPLLIWIEGDPTKKIKTVEKGIQLKFTSNSPADVPVTWSIASAGYDAGTTISADGNLKVSKDEKLNNLTVKGAAAGEDDTYTITLTPMGDINILFGNWTRKQGQISAGSAYTSMGTSVTISSTAITVNPGLGEMDFASDWEPFIGSGSLWGASGYTKGYRVVGNERAGGRVYPHGILVFYKADGGDGKPRIGVSVKMTAPAGDWPSTVINNYNGAAEYELSGQ